MRSSLSSVVLQLLALDVEDVVGFDYMSPPTQPALAGALEMLFNLGRRITRTIIIIIIIIKIIMKLLRSSLFDCGLDLLYIS